MLLMVVLSLCDVGYLSIIPFHEFAHHMRLLYCVSRFSESEVNVMFA